jgi:CRISPR system Cascade subunit CasB
MTITAEATGKPPSLDDNFVAMLEDLHANEDRAALAALRRGLGKPVGEAMEAYRYIARFAASTSTSQQEEAFYLVATLFGLYPSDSRRGEGWMKTNLGASLLELKDKMGGDGAERRFVALLNSHTDELADHLRHIISLLKSKDVLVDWRQLLTDIRWWEAANREVQRKWAKAFWGKERPETRTE